MGEQACNEHDCFQRGLIDLAGRISFGPRNLRRGLKAVEYVVNVLRLLTFIYMNRPNILHVQWFPLVEAWPEFELWWMKIAQSCGTRIVYTVHNVLPHDTGNRYKDAFRRIYRTSDGLVCHTQQGEDQLIENFDVSSSKIWVIPHGPLSVEAENIPRDKARDRLNLNAKAPLCLLFGFIRPYKGGEFLIDSWRRVKEQEPTAQLILAGRPEDGYGELLLEKIEGLELEDEVATHFEFLPQEKLNLYIQAADVLVYPYRDITQSGALLTGLTTGKPVVATDVGGFSETIRHEETGILVDYGNEEQLAGELVDLLQDPGRREQLGQTAREMVRTEYSWNAIARKTLECYKNVLSNL